MELIEYRGFKNIFIGLAKNDEDQYCLIYGKTGTPNINFTEASVDITGPYENKILTFCKERNLDVNIPFIPNDHNNLYNVQLISNKNEYYIILSILETLL